MKGNSPVSACLFFFLVVLSYFFLCTEDSILHTLWVKSYEYEKRDDVYVAHNEGRQWKRSKLSRGLKLYCLHCNMYCNNFILHLLERVLDTVKINFNVGVVCYSSAICEFAGGGPNFSGFISVSFFSSSIHIVVCKTSDNDL